MIGGNTIISKMNYKIKTLSQARNIMNSTLSFPALLIYVNLTALLIKSGEK